MKKTLYLLFVAVFLSCSNNDNEEFVDCNFAVLVSNEQFVKAPSDQLTINSLVIEGDSLKINFSTSGCNGDTWKVKLISSVDVLESNPPQRNIKLSLDNKELCEAFITKDVSFDISALQVDVNQIYLNLANSDKSILYQY